MLCVEESTRHAVIDGAASVAGPSDHPALPVSPEGIASRATAFADSPLRALGKAPKPPASDTADPASSSTRSTGVNLPVQDALRIERKRVGWTQATTATGRIRHKVEALVGLRTSDARTQAFVEFMAGGRGRADVTMFDLGDGWTRATRRVGDKTASIEFLSDESGAVTDARHPGRFPWLPPGKEREGFGTVLHEMQSVGAQAVHKVPVYYVNRNTRGYAIPTHGYVVAGEPGKGRKSGATLYGVGGDPKRGPVPLDDALLKRLNGEVRGKESPTLAEPVRAVVARLAGASFASREDFYAAYRGARGGAVDAASLHQEISSVYRLLPITTMELWPKKAGDYRVEKPPAPERDLRAFENLPKDIRYRVALKPIPQVNSVDLLEARQQFSLHQLYQDELMGRNGTGVPSELFPPVADAERRSALAAATLRFQRLPPHASDTVGNCNSGAASLLQRAVDRQRMPDRSAPAKVTAASVFGMGAGHRIKLWDPLQRRNGAVE